MHLAYPKQKFQDWFTQQWVILWGRKINAEEHPWLIGPFGALNGIGEDFIYQLAEKEHLSIERDTLSGGLLPSIRQLNLSAQALSGLSEEVVQFYENTARYQLDFSVQWNPFFKVFGVLVNKLFSARIRQLNIPIANAENPASLKSEIITLTDARSKHVKYRIWYRTFQSTGQVVYLGVYGTCTLPSGETCVKAVFPLPKGNATVIMSPNVETNGALTLDASGKRFGDPGFYFLLNDAQGNAWSQYLGSFRDRLTIGVENERLVATQIMTLWGQRALTFNYSIGEKA